MSLLRGVACASLALALLGCVSLESVTSGQIGCAESDIKITNDEEGWGSRTWTATCHGKTYYCSGHGGGKYSTPQVACKEAASDAAEGSPKVTPATAGCQFDTQCKGDRVCRAGKCVDQ
jgi:hypothetical protein